MLPLKRITAATAATIALTAPAAAFAGVPNSLVSADAGDPHSGAATSEPYVIRDGRSPDQFDQATRVAAARGAQPTVSVVDARPGGFDWGDAGIGAAGGLAIVTLAGGLGLVLTQRRPPLTTR